MTPASLIYAATALLLAVYAFNSLILVILFLRHQSAPTPPARTPEPIDRRTAQTTDDIVNVFLMTTLLLILCFVFCDVPRPIHNVNAGILRILPSACNPIPRKSNT